MDELVYKGHQLGTGWARTCRLGSRLIYSSNNEILLKKILSTCRFELQDPRFKARRSIHSAMEAFIGFAIARFGLN